MPIEIKSSSIEIHNLLSNSIERLLENIDNNLVNQVNIIVTDLEHIPTLLPSIAIPNDYHLYKRILKNSFGVTQPKQFSLVERKHLLVINIQSILQLDLTNRELDAIIAHELGHIFNVPETGVEDFENQKEFYADYFAKTLQLKDDLLSSIEKYLRQDEATNIELFRLRIEKLDSEELFIGSVKIL